MTTPEAPIQVKVDPSNPGQFFACCGLLELADRLWPGAEGWFDKDEFRVRCEGDTRTLLTELVNLPLQAVLQLENGLVVPKLIAPLRFDFHGAEHQGLTLDAWMTIQIEKRKAVAVANPPWNFWSGQQNSKGIWDSLSKALAEQLTRLADDQFSDLFNQRELLRGRFGFDPGAAWNALDVGFSPNEQGINVAASAAVELLAAIGIQRFRPMMAADRQAFIYATWGISLSPSVAAAASTGMIQVEPSERFVGRVVSRGSYGALGYSTQLRGANNE